jgi:hypothetical protein
LGTLAVASVRKVSLSGQKEKAKTAKPMMTMAPTIARYGLVVSVRWPGSFVLVIGVHSTGGHRLRNGNGNDASFVPGSRDRQMDVPLCGEETVGLGEIAKPDGR